MNELPPYPAPGEVGRVLVTEAQIKARVQELALEIAGRHVGHVPLLVAVMKGSVVFVSDLMRAMPAPIELEVMAVSSYGLGLESSGVVKIVKDLDTPAAGRHVVLVEDIIDSGLTMKYLLEHFAGQGAASVETCSLLVREGRQASGVAVDYVGFEIPPDFVVGYGLDASQKYRNLPYVAEYLG